MATIYDVDTNELIAQSATQLKTEGLVQPPDWAKFCKTGAHKEKPPVNADWWYVRTAAVLRTIYRLGPIGVSKLRTKYGGKRNRGMRPEHHYKGSGSVARKILQQLESAGFVKQDTKDMHKGRIITPKGKSFLDKIAVSLYKKAPEQPIPKESEAKKPEAPVKKVAPKKKVAAKPVETPKQVPKESDEKKVAEKQA